MNEMPIPLDIIYQIDDGDGIESSLAKTEAKYHESCKLLFNNTKLEMARKRLCSTGESNYDQARRRWLLAGLEPVTMKGSTDSIACCCLIIICVTMIHSTLSVEILDSNNVEDGGQQELEYDLPVSPSKRERKIMRFSSLRELLQALKPRSWSNNYFRLYKQF
ncbi:unnamed protein product [Mytilus coruscus]|uniref:Uncharacterized protein n=1 Tax=Mytilus coruscus TaxID=42192 RepID=A0A6J8DYW6_MYTCO|nr:unnamed protein product [Mytilus coruscus]